MRRALLGRAATIVGFAFVGFASSSEPLWIYGVAMIGALLIACADMISGQDWS